MIGGPYVFMRPAGPVGTQSQGGAITNPPRASGAGGPNRREQRIADARFCQIRKAPLGVGFLMMLAILRVEDHINPDDVCKSGQTVASTRGRRHRPNHPSELQSSWVAATGCIVPAFGRI